MQHECKITVLETKVFPELRCKNRLSKKLYRYKTLEEKQWRQ